MVSESAKVRFETIAVGVYVLWLVIVLFRFAALRPLWYDELFTLHLARVGSIRELLDHLSAGVDLNPPLIYLATRASILAFGETLWAIRLPALLGMLLGIACFYFFMRRLRGPAVAFLAVALLHASPKVFVFFLEARPYGLAFGFAGLALLAQQRRWPLLLGLACFLGVGSHYYFTVAIAMMGLAEIVRQASQKQFEWKLFAAMAMGGMALAACYPLWCVAPKEYAAGFWAKVTFHRAVIQAVYWEFVEPSIAMPLVLSLAVAVIVGNVYGGESPRVPVAEFAVLLLLAASPVLAVYLGAKITGGMHYRYVLPAAFGFAGLAAMALDRAAGGHPAACLLAAAAFAGISIPYSAKAYREFFHHQQAVIRQQVEFLQSQSPGGTVFIENGYDFASQWHQESFDYRPAFLADPEVALVAAKVDTTERALQKLKRVTEVPAFTVEETLAMIDAGKPVYYFGPGAAWGYSILQARGVTFAEIARQRENILYRLSRK